MAASEPKGLLVSGTDTGVGKTRVTTWLVPELVRQGVRVGVSKPVASGAELKEGTWVWEDPASLMSVCPLATELDEVTPHRFLEPLAPHVAARRDPSWEGRPLLMSHYQSAVDAWTGRCDALVVEGVGGLLCPITEQETVADLAAWWGRPVLLVVRQGLGTINHTLMTLEIARRRGIEIMGMVMNRNESGPLSLADETNFEELSRWVDVPVWGPIEFQANVEPMPRVMEAVARAVMQRWNGTS